MAKTSQLLSVSLCLFVLFSGCLARQQQNQCQLDRLEALEADNRVEYEGGQVETWNPNHEQFQCAGVAIVRKRVQPNGLVLPHFSNAPQLIKNHKDLNNSEEEKVVKDCRINTKRFVTSDKAISWWFLQEQHIGHTTLEMRNLCASVFLILAGNGDEEFRQKQEQGRRSRQGEESRHGHEERSCNNVFCGFDSRILAEAFNVDQRLVERLQGENDNRGHIVMVKGGELEVIRPPTMEDEREREGRQYDVIMDLKRLSAQ